MMGHLPAAVCWFLLAPGAPPLEAVDTEPTIVRQTPRGPERLVYLSVANPSATVRTGLSMRYRLGAHWRVRALLDVAPGGSWDTAWLPEPCPAHLQAEVVGEQGVLWAGQLAVPKAHARPVVIPRSPCIQAREIRPLALRGANYYPRHQPWPGLWRAMDENAFDREFAEIDRLAVNTLRTFYMADPEAGLHRADGSFTPVLLSRIDTLLRVADRHRMKVMLCLVGGGGAPMDRLDYWRRYFRTGVEPFAYDGRVLMWDLINEPGGNDGPKQSPALARWIQAMAAELRRLAPSHLLTVGLCWQFDQLRDLGVQPDVGQYHNYSGAVGVQPAGQAAVRNVADDLREIRRQYTGRRPLVIGEFGLFSVTGEEKTEGERQQSLSHQADIYRWVLQGAEAAGIAGVYNWIAFEFTPDWMGRKEQTFGVIRPDGTLKPAGAILRDTYLRWRGRSRAPWETQP